MRLRRLTGNQELKTQAMIDSAHLSAGDLAKEYLWRPMVLLFDPILLIYNTYLALIYGTSQSSPPYTVRDTLTDIQDYCISGSNRFHLFLSKTTASIQARTVFRKSPIHDKLIWYQIPRDLCRSMDFMRRFLLVHLSIPRSDI